MFRREHKVSTVKSGLSMLSSMFFFTLDMNIQSRLLEQVAVGGSSSAALISKSAYFLRSNARLASRLAILAFSMFMLKGFTIYSSAPIWRPSRMFFSSPSAVSSSIGIWEVSMLLLMAVHNSSPHISGIMMSERISSGQNCFTIASASLPLPHTCTL